MTYYLHQVRLWWWQMKREGAELERDRAMLMWRDACDDVKRANARIEELHRRAMRDVMVVA